MRFILYTNRYSPHELPLFLACAEVFDDAVYVVNQPWIQDGSRKGWCPDLKGRKTIILQDVKPEARESVFAGLLSDDSLLMYGCYDTPYQDLICKSKGIVIYASERWLKPLGRIPGIFHLFSLRFIRRMFNIERRLKNCQNFLYFPEGVRAAGDMARLCGLMHGDLRCLFRAPKLDFERKPGGRIFFSSPSLHLPATPTAKSPLQLPTTTTTKYCLDKMRIWGYFVEPSQLTNTQLTHPPTHNSSTLKVLWVGRLLNWKRVDTIIRAVGEYARHFPNSNLRLQLDIYGEGPKKEQLSCMARRYGDVIRIHPFIAMSEVRNLMRDHDVYVLSSNGCEGWGAVVSEALEEGMKVIGTYEAGSSATILPESNLFHAGDWRGLMKKLRDLPKQDGIGDWRVEFAANAIYTVAREIHERKGLE